MDVACVAVASVLEMLAMRLPPGEVDDLVARLPLWLHEALRRGAAARDERSLRLGAEEFVERVAELEQTTLDAAADHVRAVLETLRDAVGAAEFSDVVAELPPDYTPLLPRP
jgi:uncharacterized protein (DUF2267 family)